MAATPTTTMIMGHIKWDPNVCGNTADGGKQNCGNQPTKLCTGCRLVGYCSKECQKGHWRVHKVACQGPIRTEVALPHFSKEGRAPADYIFPGAKQFNYPQLWGTSRPMDVLNLPNNEGQHFSGDLMILFANCNDLRDVLKTVNSLPANYRGTLTCEINHERQEVALRNILILLVAITQPPRLATEIIVHLWYSALLTRPMIDAMRTSILPYLTTFIDTILRNVPDTGGVFNVKWPALAGVNCDVVLSFVWSDFIALQQLLTSEQDKAEAMGRRYTTIVHPRFTDAMHLRSYNQQPQWRSSVNRYEDVGVLSPFGACIEAFDVLNPTVFIPDTTTYNQSGFAAPLDGWSIQELMAFPSGGPSHDLLGQLYFFLRAELEKFCVRITQGPKIGFIVTHIDGRHAHCSFDPTFGFDPRPCDRIHISKLAMEPHQPDGMTTPINYGLPKMLDTYAKLLKPRRANPNATLIATFEQYYEKERKAALTKREREKIVPKLRKYGYVKPPSLETPEGQVFKTQIYFAGLLLAPFDDLFDEYVAQKYFKDIARVKGLEMKEQNTIVDKWPARFTKAPGEEGAEKAFRQKLGENAKYEERVVEFKRQRPITRPSGST